MPDTHPRVGDVIQGLWIGPLSVIERLSITSFLDNGHKYHLYCYEDLPGVPPGADVKDANAILPASAIFRYERGSGRGSVSAFSNVFRYKLLLEKGGWWADTDTVCLRPFDFQRPVIFASEMTRTSSQTASCVIKLPRGHAAAEMCYDIASKADRATLKWGEIGPKLVGQVVVHCGLEDLVEKPVVFCPIPYWHWRALLAENPQPVLASVTAATHAMHLYHEMWRRAEVGQSSVIPPKVIPPTSLFGGLLARFGVG